MNFLNPTSPENIIEKNKKYNTTVQNLNNKLNIAISENNIEDIKKFETQIKRTINKFKNQQNSGLTRALKIKISPSNEIIKYMNGILGSKRFIWNNCFMPIFENKLIDNKEKRNGDIYDKSLKEFIIKEEFLQKVPKTPLTKIIPIFVETVNKYFSKQNKEKPLYKKGKNLGKRNFNKYKPQYKTRMEDRLHSSMKWQTQKKGNPFGGYFLSDIIDINNHTLNNLPSFKEYNIPFVDSGKLIKKYLSYGTVEVTEFILVKERGKFFIVLTVRGIPEIELNLNKIMEIPKVEGIDKGVTIPLQTSSGKSYGNNIKECYDTTVINEIKRLEEKKQRLQSELSHKENCIKNGVTIPNNFKKINKNNKEISHKKSIRMVKKINEISKIDKKITNLRKEFSNQTAYDLIVNSDVNIIVSEDLNIKNMTKSAKGSIEEPGSNVKQKSGLNRSILRIGWGILNNKIKNKCEEYGKVLVSVNAAYTSQICPKCKHKSKDNRETQSNFTCINCGYTENADYVASINIAERGLIELKEFIDNQNKVIYTESEIENLEE